MLFTRDLDTIWQSLPAVEFWDRETRSTADWQRNSALGRLLVYFLVYFA